MFENAKYLVHSTDVTRMSRFVATEHAKSSLIWIVDVCIEERKPIGRTAEKVEMSCQCDSKLNGLLDGNEDSGETKMETQLSTVARARDNDERGIGNDNFERFENWRNEVGSIENSRI